MFEDVILLTSQGVLILPHLAESVKLSAVGDRHQLKNSPLVSVEKNGLFDAGSPNYYTYYPDTTEADFTPQDSDFVQPIVRALSEVVVHKGYYPVDFSRDNVLKESEQLLYGQTIYIDHEANIGNALGAVAETSWEKAYKSKEGWDIPSGINVRLKIDGKSNPRIARLMSMTPPAIHSFSVTVRFAWKPSHENIPLEEFYNKMGTYDDQGNLYTRVATKILRYDEISLVSHGADPFAQIIKDGEISNPRYAHLSNSAGGKTFLHVGLVDMRNDTTSNSATPNKPIITTQTEHSNTENLKRMNKELLLLLATSLSFSLEGIPEDQQQPKLLEALAAFTTSKSDTEELLRTAQSSLQAEKDKVIQLTQEVADLKAGSDPALSLVGKEAKETLKAEFIRLRKLLNPNDAMVELAETLDFKTLGLLKAQAEKEVDSKFPLSCKKCSSTDISRASAAPGEGGHQGETKQDLETILRNRKIKSSTSKMHVKE